MATVRVKAEIAKSVNVTFPLYLAFSSCEDDEEIVFGEDYMEFWKIESKSKITIIREDSLSMAVITYRDEEEDAFYEHVTDAMLKEQDGWNIVKEKVYDEAFNRLIDRVTNA
jgi:hypothetical protein